LKGTLFQLDEAQAVVHGADQPEPSSTSSMPRRRPAGTVEIDLTRALPASLQSVLPGIGAIKMGLSHEVGG